MYLTSPDERYYVDSGLRMFATLTKSDGSFALDAPATDSAIVNVLLSGDRRLTAIADLSRTTGPVLVDLATTLVTEFVRQKAAEFGFSFSEIFGNPRAKASLEKLFELTERLVTSSEVFSTLTPDHLKVINIPLVLHSYVVSFGTGKDHVLSDEWVTFLRAVKDDQTSPDVKFRPLAITTLAFLQATSVGSGLAVDERGQVIAWDGSVSHFLVITPGGSVSYRPATFGGSRFGLAVVPDGRTLSIGTPWGGYLSLIDFNTDPPTETWLLAPDRSKPDLQYEDVTVDDEATPGLYVGGASRCLVLRAQAFLSGGTPSLDVFAGKFDDGLTRGAEFPEEPTLENLRLAIPKGVTFHRGPDKTPTLYVADSGLRLVLAVNLATRQVRRIAGLPTDPRNSRRCVDQGLSGVPARTLELHSPNKILVDKTERLFVLDGDMVRLLVEPLSDSPVAWHLAGAPHTTTGCLRASDQPYLLEGFGEARFVRIGDAYKGGFDMEGNLIFSDNRSNRLYKLWTAFLK